jgi:hypothetical protein
VGPGSGQVILALLLAFLLRVLAGLRASLCLSRWCSSAACVLAHSDISFHLVNLHCHLSAIYLLFTAPVGRLGGWVGLGSLCHLSCHLSAIYFDIYLPSIRHITAIYPTSILPAICHLFRHLPPIYLLFSRFSWVVGRAWDIFAIYLPSLRHLPAIYGLSTRFGWVEGRAWDISTVYLTSIQLSPLIYPAIYLLSTCHILPYIIIYCHLSSGRVVGRAWDIFNVYLPFILPFIL